MNENTETTITLIAGGNKGLGHESARRLVEAGHQVWIGVRDPQHGRQATGGRLDVLVNNAGVPGTWAPAADAGPDDFADVIAVNLLGPVRVTQALLPLLRRRSTPRLVMVSSGMGSLGLQSTDEVYADIAHLPYPASKAALNVLTDQYAKALPQILVTAVDPGLTATELTGGTGHSVEQGSQAIVTAALDTTGPTGRFTDRHGATPW